MEENEGTNQFVQFVLRIVCPVSETGRIEQWIEDRVFGAKIIFAKKYPKSQKIRIVEEGRNGVSTS